MNESFGSAANPSTSGLEIVHEAYSFACMRCGHAWEQAYDIEHHVGADGHTHVAYLADGRRVPSPLTAPSCTNCECHQVRIMQAGLVSSRHLRWGQPARRNEPPRPDPTRNAAATADAAKDGGKDGRDNSGHHWYLNLHLPHIFHRKPDDVA